MKGKLLRKLQAISMMNRLGVKNYLKRYTFFFALLFSTHAYSNQTNTNHIESIVLGSGCFWGAEKGYEQLPGVIDAVSGYSDGRGVQPNYRSITKYKNKFNKNNFAEVVQVTYNSNEIALEDIFIHYLESHDPTQLNRQGNDIGTQYRSIVLYSNNNQKLLINRLLSEYQNLLNEAEYGKIQTSVKPLEKFYKAETYHQDYLKKNPNGYCPDLSTGVVFNKKIKDPIDNTDLLSGKKILIIDSKDYCPYCDKFDNDVLNSYQGSVPYVKRTSDQLDGINLSVPTWATPTIIFLDNGKEVFSNQGYMNAKEFYKALGSFKLGNTEAYDVAFNEGTDARFCKEYQIFKNTPDGIFVDKLSGQPLFNTDDRFVSRSGWLSFTKPVDGATYELPDNRYGMRRTEVRSKSSDIHLGHVFDDGPNGLPRYCINATVLEFIPDKS